MKKFTHICSTIVFLLFFHFISSGIASKSVRPETSDLMYSLINDFSVHNQTWAISQNPNNYIIYLANSEGLIEYNGISWKKFSLKDDLPVRSVVVHGNGYIFTGSFEEFGFWRYSTEGALIYNSLTHLTELEKNDEIWKIFILKDKVYFQSFTSIYIYDFEKVEKIKAPFAMLFLHPIDDNFIAQIIDTGLFWFKDQKFTFIKNSEIFADNKVHAIIPFNEQNWMICTDNDGIYLFDGKNFNYFQSEASTFLKNFTCNAAKQFNENTFVFGSILNGLILTDKKGNIQRTYNTYNGLKNNTVLSLFIDADKGLWIGLDENVNFLDPLSPITHYNSSNGTLGTIYALYRQSNQLYIGTNHGLFQADIEQRGLIFQFNNLRFIPESHGQVWTLGKYGDQILCGHNEGTFIVEKELLQKISSITGGWTFMPFGEYLLGGTYTGIIILGKDSEGKWQFRNKIENFSEPTRHIEVDYLGYIWASHHQKGIYKIELSENLLSALKVEYFPNIQNKSYNIRVFKINNRVVFTTSENIYTYDFVRSQIIPIDPLSDDLGEFKTVNQISHYQKNDYWFIKDDKIGLFEIGLDFSAKKKFEILLDNINLPQRKIQLVDMGDSTVIIPNPQNFDTYSLSLNGTVRKSSRLTVEKLVFYGDQKSKVYYGSFDDVKTSWNTNNLSVYFSDPSFFDQTSKTYQYRIKELDSAWQSTKVNHFTYLGLKHGLYTLEIKSNNGADIETPFYVGKPWYYSYVALLCYAVLFIISIWSLFKFIRFKINRQKELVAMGLRQYSLEQELDYKSYELMLTIRYLIHKNEILTMIQKEINEIKQYSSKYPIKNLKNMERIIREGLDTQTDDWKNAMSSLKLSQQGFFKKLMEQYPELTTNDLRLCSYLRMNFSTKEIARLLNNSTRAVEISRYRLRKKMKIDHDINLTEFLMSEIFSDNINNPT